MEDAETKRVLRRVQMYVVSEKEGGVRFVTLRGFSMGRVSGRRSRFYNVADGSPYLPDEWHTMYRRAHNCLTPSRLPGTSISVCCFRRMRHM